MDSLTLRILLGLYKELNTPIVSSFINLTVIVIVFCRPFYAQKANAFQKLIDKDNLVTRAKARGFQVIK